ncbi:hypothetical protein PVL29_003835 [Vitis rotundifolia]|uniref:Eukaryotic translation initiation factor 5B n=1 Tax=Vitis rotundifolia TaxID=103349 RepID=A0AA39AF47_VITRO|nr:hypothetical protein PVL29_003835 [Vitis rotundifolia]
MGRKTPTAHDDVPAVAVAAAVKGNTKGGVSSFDLLDGIDCPVSEQKSMDETDDASVIFTGKKKSSKGRRTGGDSVFAGFSFEGLGEGDEDRDEQDEENEDIASVVFSGKKKSSKSSRKSEQPGIGRVATSKNKKKKKKGGRTAQEEDDLDKILAELGEGPSVSKPTTPQEEKDQIQPQPVVAADTTSAAAKKKKKKKEKEKEKKAAAAAAAAAATTAAAGAVEVKEERPVVGTKSKVPGKKLPKHVREMQEALARRKEAEERKKREEEERLRKEEGERHWQEELERLAEEVKRRKKEREKEKLLKKKQEGKLLTGKQREEARRSEAMRNQILANAGGLPISLGDAPTKRPKYQTKKAKSNPSEANGAALPKLDESTEAKESLQETVPELKSLEPEKLEEVDSVNVEEKSEVSNATEEKGAEEEEDDDDEEWDAKRWDDAVVTLPDKSAFADEEADSETEQIKGAAKPILLPNKVVSAHPIKTQDVRSEESQIEVEATNKSRKKKAPRSDAPPQETEENLRSPICCIMGHVDTGKTKLLDCIRGTNVQEGEAGGITQRIGATYFPADNIRERTKELKADAKLKVPGLLVVDTPGHESFTNLRSRGSGLCDIAILVVDIMHGLEPQTIESLNLLKMRNTEFIVALNKVDRLYGWKVCRNSPIQKAMKQQSKDVKNEFSMRLTQLYYNNREMGETFSIVPTSAISGEGIPDLLLLLVHWTQNNVLEVKVVEGHGTTIDVVLVNGVLHEGDQIVVCGMQGPIVTTIRALLTQHPMKELRVKGTYLHHKQIKAAQGIKIAAQGLEHAIAGTGLYVVGADDELEDIKEASMEDMKSVLSRIDKSGEGVYVQASTLGPLEALLEFLKSPAVNIAVSGIGIGPVHKKDVMKASVMLEKKKEYATILAFDVKVNPEARELADDMGVKIFITDVIYHLFDQFKAHIDNLKEEKKREAADEAVFPCVLKIQPKGSFNNKDPIILGVDVLEGIVKVGTPICIPQRDFIDIGRIASIQKNRSPVDIARKGQEVAIMIVGTNPEEKQKMHGRHFGDEDELVSRISRKSIDVLKANYRDDISLEEWKLVAKLKSLFKIQ